MKIPSKIHEGDVFEVDYPFSAGEILDPLHDYENGVYRETWEVGPYTVLDCMGGDWRYANGIGKMILTVISTHTPGKYPKRVFFTRQWRDPDGKEFGKTLLHIKTEGNFKKLLKGYGMGDWGYEFDMKPKQERLDEIRKERERWAS